MEADSQHDEFSDNDRQPEHRFKALDVKLEKTLQGLYFTIDKNNTRLTNTTYQPEEAYSFPGTRAEIGLTRQDEVFWQVRVDVQQTQQQFGFPHPRQQRGGLFEMGIASEKDLRAVKYGKAVAAFNSKGVTLACGHDLRKRIFAFKVEHIRKPATRGEPWIVHDESFSTTFWFVFCGPKSTLYICNSQGEILWESDVDMSQDLHPFFHVKTDYACGKRIILDVISGSDLLEPEPIIKMLKYISYITSEQIPEKEECQC